MALSKELASFQVSFKQGEVIFSENDLSRDLYVLLTGKVEAFQKGVSLAVLEKQGSFFGEMAILSSQPRSATLKALEGAIMLKVPPQDLPILMKNMPDLAMRMARNLAMMVRNANKELLEAWEAMEFKKMAEAACENEGHLSMDETLPKIVREIKQKQHNNQLELAKSYLRSNIFVQPFCHSIEKELSLFIEDVTVRVDETTDNNPKGLICGVDFHGAASGTFIFMTPPKRLESIGLKLFGEHSEEKMVEDVMLELVRRMMEQVKKRIPGLNMEISAPEIVSNYQVPPGDFFGIKIATNRGFMAWVQLNK